MITNALNLVRAAAEPRLEFNNDVAKRELGSRIVEAPVYHGKCNTRIAVQLEHYESLRHTTGPVQFEHAFEIRISPADEDEADTRVGVFVNVLVYADRFVVESTEPSLGPEWKHILYKNSFPRSAILTTADLIRSIDRNLRRTNYYENFARWEQGLEPIPVLK